MHKFKQVHIPTCAVYEHDFTEKSHPSLYRESMSRVEFLELVNDWNRISLLQTKVTGTVNWLYIALWGENGN